MRTAIIAINANASRGIGIFAKPIRKVSPKPSNMEAKTAPGIEPIPPTTIRANVLYAGTAPMVG